MARSNFNKSDLDLFLNSDANFFKSKIRNRVSSWKNATDNYNQTFLKMIMIHYAEQLQSDKDFKMDWDNSISKLIELKYDFYPDTYLPKYKFWYQLNDENFAKVYVAMLETLKNKGFVFEESDIYAMYKYQYPMLKYGLHESIVLYFKNLGIYPEEMLEELKVRNIFKNFNDESVESIIYRNDIAKVYNLNKKRISSAEKVMVEDYYKNQSLKSERILKYLEYIKPTKETVMSFLNDFYVSNVKMESTPALKNKYHVDICIDLKIQNKLKNEYFYTDCQIDLIKKIENIFDIQFIGKIDDSFFDNTRYDKHRYQCR